MGANLTTDYKLHISLDKLAYNPGEIINGTFCFDYGNDQYKKKNISIRNPAVVLSIITYETMTIRTSPKTKQSILVTQAINIKELLDIKKNPDVIIPFSLQIPFNAMPSFEWPHMDYINCNVRSLVQVEIKDCKAIGTSFFVIRKNSTPLSSPLEVIEKSHKRGIFTGGDVLLKANYQTNSFPIYSQVPFTFTVDFSQSKYKIKGINYVLKRHIKFFDSHRELVSEYTDDLMEKNIKGNMTKLQTENCVVELKDPSEIQKQYCMKMLGMANGLKPDQLISLMPTFKGSMFQCDYYIKIKAVTDTPLLSAVNSPTLNLPIDVFSPVEYIINNVTINPESFPTMDQVGAQGYPQQQQYSNQYPQQQQNPSQEQYGSQIPMQQPYGQPPQIIPPSQPQQQYPPQQQQYPPQQQQYPPQQQQYPPQQQQYPPQQQQYPLPQVIPPAQFGSEAPAPNNGQYPHF